MTILKVLTFEIDQNQQVAYSTTKLIVLSFLKLKFLRHATLSSHDYSSVGELLSLCDFSDRHVENFRLSLDLISGNVLRLFLLSLVNFHVPRYATRSIFLFQSPLSSTSRSINEK